MIENYCEPEEIAKLWDVSVRQIQRLCKEGRIEGSIKFGNVWAIPKDTKKPTHTGKLKPGRKTKIAKYEQHM